MVITKIKMFVHNMVWVKASMEGLALFNHADNLTYFLSLICVRLILFIVIFYLLSLCILIK